MFFKKLLNKTFNISANYVRKNTKIFFRTILSTIIIILVKKNFRFEKFFILPIEFEMFFSNQISITEPGLKSENLKNGPF